MLTKIKFHKKTLGRFGVNGRFGSERYGGVTITRSETQVFLSWTFLKYKTIQISPTNGNEHPFTKNIRGNYFHIPISPCFVMGAACIFKMSIRPCSLGRSMSKIKKYFRTFQRRCLNFDLGLKYWHQITTINNCHRFQIWDYIFTLKTKNNSDCNRTRTHNHLVRKQTLTFRQNHLAR